MKIFCCHLRKRQSISIFLYINNSLVKLVLHSLKNFCKTHQICTFKITYAKAFLNLRGNKLNLLITNIVFVFHRCGVKTCWSWYLHLVQKARNHRKRNYTFYIIVFVFNRWVELSSRGRNSNVNDFKYRGCMRFNPLLLYWSCQADETNIISNDSTQFGDDFYFF